MMSNFRFRPGLASTVTTLMLLPGLLGLGFWQLDRAAEKMALFERYRAAVGAPIVDLNEITTVTAQTLQWRAGRAVGRYIGPNILLDNRVREGQTGYEVYTPFQTATRAVILVARGWIAAGLDRMRLPAMEIPTGEQVLVGHIGWVPWVGIELDGATEIENLEQDLRRVQRIDFDVLDQALNLEFRRLVIYLDPLAPHGFERSWARPTRDAGKHTAYAVQWFAMAGVWLILYVKINRKTSGVSAP